MKLINLSNKMFSNSILNTFREIHFKLCVDKAETYFADTLSVEVPS